MNKVTFNDAVIPVPLVPPLTKYVNFYSTPPEFTTGETEHATIEAAENTRGRKGSGFILEVKRDSNGDFTFTKVKEFN